MYEDVLTRSRSLRLGIIGTVAPPPTDPPPGSQGGEHVPEDICPGVPRNTLLTSCPQTYCPTNGACVVYDQSPTTTLTTGCDYGLASTPSFCSTIGGKAETCEFQCFAAYTPQSQFKFFIPFSSQLGATVPRKPTSGDTKSLKTTDIPFMSNSFVTKIGALELTSSVSEVMISGGRSEKGSTQRADASISTDLLTKAQSVTSLSLLNINLSQNDLPKILASASTSLKTLNLRNANLKSLPDGVFDHTQQLETLMLAQNGLSGITINLPKLTTLDLSGNAVTSVAIKAPNLKTLDLSGNKLASIPTGVFALNGLSSLNLKGNSIAFPLALSETQVAFLKSVAVVEFDPVPAQPATSPQLETSTAVVVNGIPVVTVSEETANKINQSRASGSTAGSLPGSSHGSRASGSTAAGFSSDGSHGVTPSSQAESGGSLLSGPHSSGSGNIGSAMRSTPGKSITPATSGDLKAGIEGGGMSVMTKLLMGGLGSMVLIVLLAAFVIRKRRSRGKEEESGFNEMTEEEANSVQSDDTLTGTHHIVSWWRDEDMLANRLKSADISDERVISSEGSSVTWLVSYRGSKKLVSKRLIPGEGPAYDAKALQLFSEAKIASTLTYPSIVPLVGVAWTDKTDLQVLYEYMSNGDLSSLLSRTDSSTLPWMPEKLQFAIDIIEALVYTHSFNPPLLHRDLKASNVLLDEDFKAKLGDFGCARHESDSNTMTTSEIGTGRWLAPEILSGSTSYGSSSDIYSFGVVLCELDTHRVPYADEAVATEGGEMALLQRVARGELRPSVSASCPSAIRDMAEACLAFDPMERPNAMQISHLLRSLRTREADRSGFV